MNFPMLWKSGSERIETPHLETDLSEELNRALMPAPDRSKYNLGKDREVLKQEITDLQNDKIAANGRIIDAENVISKERSNIAGFDAAIAEREALIGVLDKTEADIDALSRQPSVIPTQLPKKPSKARKAEAEGG